MAAAQARQETLTKPPGSLGRLESLACWLAGWPGSGAARDDAGRALIFAGNHGVCARGVSPYPTDVTGQMVANFEAGGAAINALSRWAGAPLRVIPLDLDRPTADLSTAAAMTADEGLAAFRTGMAAVPGNARLLVLGEMGIGNTTAAAALSGALFGGPAAQWTGPGTGLDPDGVARKAAVIEQAWAHHGVAGRDPFDLLCRLGGRELAAIAGAILSARYRRLPVILDGFVATAAAAPLAVARSGALDHCLAGHVSAEPGHARLLAHLSLEPLLSLQMRLGEGSGAILALGIVQAAWACHSGMATFGEAGISDRPGAGS